MARKILRTAEEFRNAPPGHYEVRDEAAKLVVGALRIGNKHDGEAVKVGIKKSFSNATIQEPIHGKPHICKRVGWWRVSSWKRETGALYYQAHDFANKLNAKERNNVQSILATQSTTKANKEPSGV